MKGKALGGGGFRTGDVRHHVIACVDLDAPSPTAVPIPTGFLAHGFAFDPRAPWRAAAFEKKGPGACVLDLRYMALAAPIETVASRRFYGHGAFSADGSLLYATESRLDADHEGALVVRDADTLRELGTLPTHGRAPHDCALIDGGRVMVVANGGGPMGADAPSVTWVEVASGRLLDRAELDDPRVNAGHLAVGDGGALAVVSAPRDGLDAREKGAVSLRLGDGPLRARREPASAVSRVVGEALSALIEPRSRTAYATHPMGDCVTAWSVDDGSHRGVMDFVEPRGIALTLDGEWLLVTHRVDGGVRLTALDAATRAPTGVAVDPSFLSGSHVVVGDW